MYLAVIQPEQMELKSAGLFNIDKKEVKYFQAAGIFNVVGGKVKGFQVAGINNTVLDTSVWIPGCRYK